MRRPLSLLLLAALPAALGACCSDVEPRFWEVRDDANGRVAYAVDTVLVPLGKIDDKYVDGSGAFVCVDRPHVVRQITEQQYESATRGAGFGVHYCPMLKACWATARQR